MKSLINWEIDDTVEEFKVLPISKEDIEAMIDIIRALSCTFTTSDDLDFSYFNEKKEGCKVRLGINADKVPFYSVLAKYYLKDGVNFERPTMVTKNNLENNVFEHVAAAIFLEKIGVIDVPDRPPFQHNQATSKTFTNNVTKRTSYPGITSLLRSIIYEEKSAIYCFTALVGVSAGTGTLWSVKVVIPVMDNPGEAMDAIIYFTFPNELIDQPGTVN